MGLNFGVRWPSTLLLLLVFMLSSEAKMAEDAYADFCKRASISSNDTAQQSLLNAVKNDQPENMLPLTNEVNISMTTAQGETLLHVAIYCRSTEVLTALLRNGADPNILSKGNLSAIWFATSLGNIEMIRKLKEYGADLHYLNKNYYTIPGVNASLLHLAAYHGYEEVIAFLLKNGLDIDARDSYLKTPLHAAMGNALIDTAKLLIKLGSSVNAKNRDGVTPLHLACRIGDVDLFNFLIAKGGNVHELDLNGFGALDYASESGPEVVNELFKMGLSYNTTIRQLCTPLHTAAEKGQVETVNTLLNHGFDVNMRNSVDKTPLHRAVCSTQLGTVQELIRRGAGVNDVDYRRRTPLHLAAINYNYEILQYLVAHGADINAQDAFGRAPLHYLSGASDIRGMSLLLDKGAEVNVKDVRGQNPLFWAVNRGNKQAIELLVSKGAQA